MSPPPPETISYCLGYWALPGNRKYPPGHYDDLLPQTLALLRGANLVLLHDDPGLRARVAELAREHEIRLIDRQIPIPALPAWPESAQAVAACRAMALDRAGPRPDPLGREKGVVHFWRDLTDSGPEVYRAMQAIWLSKVPLLAALALENPFDTRWFGWVDASISRTSGQRANWDFARQSLPPGKITHYRSLMQLQARPLPLSAGVLLGDAPAWARFAAAYAAALPRSLAEPYGHDEETVICGVLHHQPDLFRCLNPPDPPALWRRTLRRLRRALT